jgi:hypothetical protein
LCCSCDILEKLILDSGADLSLRVLGRTGIVIVKKYFFFFFLFFLDWSWLALLLALALLPA